MHVQLLENRRLFAVGIVGRELQITGTDGNDVILVTQVDANTIRVEENGAVTLWDDRRVKSIFMNGNTKTVGGVARNRTAGTAGDDRLEVVPGAVPLTEKVRANGGAGNDTLISAGDGRSLFNGQDGDDNLTGGAAADTLDGGEGRNVLAGGDGADKMSAGLGADRFDGGAGVDEVSYRGRTADLTITLDGNANDGQVITGTTRENDNVMESVEQVRGGNGNDTITAGASNVENIFFGGAGNDRLDGRDGADDLDGGAGDDQLTGGGGADYLAGIDGNDQLTAGDGNDLLWGGAGTDTLDGDEGADELVGGPGADTLRGGVGADLLFAQDGQVDTLIDGGADFDIAHRDGNDPAAVNAEILR